MTEEKTVGTTKTTSSLMLIALLAFVLIQQIKKNPAGNRQADNGSPLKPYGPPPDLGAIRL